MKALLNILLVCVAGLSLAACAEGLGDFDSAPPYATERTATHEQTAAPEPAPAPVSEPAPKAAPMCKACDTCKTCSCSENKSRIATLEVELAACREASNRVRDAYSEELKK